MSDPLCAFLASARALVEDLAEEGVDRIEHPPAMPPARHSLALPSEGPVEL